MLTYAYMGPFYFATGLKKDLGKDTSFENKCENKKSAE
jgi:hypothetical protein